ncbi:MAG TPA: DUF4124 domain-containing protein [Dokdonella sp.]
MALLLCVAATPALAQKSDHNRYKWRDASGNLHYSDSLPPEAAKYGYEIVNPQGIVVKRVAREKTAAELAAAKAAAAREKAELEMLEARARADAQLLANFPQESDLLRAQRQRIEMLDQHVNAARISLRNQEQALAELLGNAADSERAGKAVSERESSQIADMRKQVDRQRDIVGRREAERRDAGARFESEVQRYRELKARKPGTAPGA